MNDIVNELARTLNDLIDSMQPYFLSGAHIYKLAVVVSLTKNTSIIFFPSSGLNTQGRKSTRFSLKYFKTCFLFTSQNTPLRFRALSSFLSKSTVNFTVVCFVRIFFL